MTGDRPSSFSPLSLEQLFALELPAVEYAVDEILPLGSAALLSAREKAGKGLLALDLCAAVSLGEPFLDRAVREGPAIYCAAEEHIRDVRQRIAARLGDRRDAPLYVLPLDGSSEDRLKLDDTATMQKLWNMVVALEPVVVVLDTLRELHDRQEDKSDEMGPLLRPVRQMAHQTNVAIIVNHHQNKAGAFRGSTAIRAAFDLEWAFNRTDPQDDQGPPRGVLRIEGRHGPRVVLNLRLGPGLRWELHEAVIAPPDPGAREQILAHLTAVNTWQTASEIAEGSGIKLKTVQNVLAAMLKEIPRPIVAKGTGVKNDPRQYRTRSPHFEGCGADGGENLIPPDESPIGGKDRGNHCSGAVGEAGSDRWTR